MERECHQNDSLADGDRKASRRPKPRPQPRRLRRRRRRRRRRAAAATSLSTPGRWTRSGRSSLPGSELRRTASATPRSRSQRRRRRSDRGEPRPTAATPMDDPHCSCKLKHDYWIEVGGAGGSAGETRLTAAIIPVENRDCSCRLTRVRPAAGAGRGARLGRGAVGQRAGRVGGGGEGRVVACTAVAWVAVWTSKGGSNGGSGGNLSGLHPIAAVKP